jgi:hypothetical protein
MVAINKQYAREMHEKFGFFATWLPNLMLQPGAIGELRDQVFEPKTSLSLKGIRFEVDKDPRPVDLDYTSSDAVAIEASAAGNARASGGPQAGGRIAVSFKRADAVAFQATGCIGSRIADLDSLGREILARQRRGEWNDSHVVVTDVIAVKTATILISNSQNGRIELGVAAKSPGSVPALATIDASATVTRAVGIGTRIVGQSGLTPLFKVAGIKRRIFGSDTFAIRKEGELSFGALDHKEMIEWR